MVEEVTSMATEFLKEASDSLRKAKVVCGSDIEWALARRKLDLIENKPEATPLTDDTFLQGRIDTRKIRFKEILQDYEGPDTKDHLDSVKKLEESTDEAIRNEFKSSARDYEDLRLKEGDDLTLVARNDMEKAMIMKAAKLLDYYVHVNGKYGDGRDKLEFYPPEKHHTGGNLGMVIKTRIEVGIKNMLNDYDSMRGSATDIGRPVLRTIVSMVDAEAKVFRSPAREIHPV